MLQNLEFIFALAEIAFSLVPICIPVIYDIMDDVTGGYTKRSNSWCNGFDVICDTKDNKSIVFEVYRNWYVL